MNSTPFDSMQSVVRDRSRILLTLICLLTGILTYEAGATTRYWQGTAGNSYWSTPGNWFPVGTPQNGDNLVFTNVVGGIFVTNDLPALTVGYIEFDVIEIAVLGNPLSVSSEIITLGDPGGPGATVDCGMTLTGDVTFNAVYGALGFGTVNLNGYTLTLSTFNTAIIYGGGVIGGTGNLISQGTVSFENANTFDGTVEVRSGTNYLASEFGPVFTEPVQIDSGAALEFVDDNEQIAGPVLIMPSGKLLLDNGVNTFSSIEMLGGTLDSGPFGMINLVGEIDAETTNQTATVAGNVAMEYDEFDNAPVLNANGPFVPSLNVTANLFSTGYWKTGIGTMRLFGTNSNQGQISLYQGVTEADSSSAFGTATVYQYGGGITLNDANINTPLFVEATDPQPDGRSGGLLTVEGTSSWAGQITLGSNLFVLDIGDITLSGPISGSGGITFSTGTAHLTGSQANTFTGTLISQCQLLELDKPASVQAYAGTLTAGGGNGGPYETRWDNAHQNAFGNVTLYPNGLVNLNNNNEDFDFITFNGGTIETGSGEAAIYEQVTVNPTNSSAVINGDLDLPTGYTASFNVGAGTPANGDDLIVNAVINGTTSDFIKEGAGTMSLAGINSFQGTVLLTGGILAMDNSGALSIAPVVVSSGATLKLDVTATIGQALEMSGDGVNGTLGALDLPAGGVVAALNGNIQLDAETTLGVGSGSQLQLGGVISGTGPLTETGLGEVNMDGNSANTYTGTTFVNQGNLAITKPNLITGVPGNLVIGTESSPFNFSGTTATVQAQTHSIGGTNLTVNGGSLYQLINSSSQFFTGVNLVNGGSIATGAGTLQLGGGPAADVVTVTPGKSGASVISGNLYLITGGNFAVGQQSQPFIGTGPALDLQAGLNDQFADGISKSGSGQMRLLGNNSFSSAMTVNGGTLILPSSGALGNSPSIAVNNNGILTLESNITIQETLTLNSTASTALFSLNGSNTWNAGIILDQTAAINVEPAGGYLDLPGAISGPGGLTAVGAGTIQFEGTNANTYAGLTTVSNGVLEAARYALAVRRNFMTGQLITNKVSQISIPGDVGIGSDASGASAAVLQIDYLQPFPSTANVTVHSSGALDFVYLGAGQLQPGIDTIQTLTGSGQVNLVLNSSLTINNSTPFTFYGSINGDGAFSKMGSGTMTTWGNIDTTGSVGLNGGDWEFFGARHNGGIGVANAGSRLGGDGTVDGLVSVAGASVGVDSHYPGQQGSTFSMGGLTNSTGATVQLNMFGPSPTGGNDQIAITSGGVWLNSDTVLSTSFNYPPREGDVIDLISLAGGLAITGNFANFPDGVVTLVGQTPVVPSYHGGAGHDFTLTVTNLALAYAGYQLAEGNGNQTVEPNECNLLYVALTNQQANSLTITNAYLRATNITGVVVTIPVAEYPVIAAGQTAANVTPFQFSTDTNLPCGGAVGFELVLGVTNEGQFAIDFSPVSGNDCSHPTGPCDSCNVVAGQFTTNTPTAQPLYFVGAPSICYPPKAYPGTNPAPLLSPAPYLVNSFTNSTTNSLCLTAELEFDCPSAPTNALGVAAYLGTFDPANPSVGYLGDIGQGGPPYPAFSFQVPAQTNFTLVVMAQTTNLVCDNYVLQLFGLPCPAPTLTIEPDATTSKLRMDWSTAYPGWLAQQKGSLGGTFTNVPQPPAILDSRYAITNISPAAIQFYRLKN